MKYMILIAVFMFSTLAQASKVCDLSANDQAVEELNDIFNSGHMRGEDHVIGLKFLYEDRMLLIENCVDKNATYGITKQELIDTLDNMEYKLSVYVADMEKAIQLAIDMDRIGMATELRMEMDEEVELKTTLMAKIKKLI